MLSLYVPILILAALAAIFAIFSLVMGAVLFTIFVVRQLTAEEPLLHIRLFRDTTFTMSTVLSLVVVTGLFGVVYLLPLFLQQVRGYDAITTGLLLMPQAATAAVLSRGDGSARSLDAV